MEEKIKNSKVPTIEVEKLPAIISETLGGIKDADDEVKEAMAQAKAAKNVAEEASKMSTKWSWDGSNKKEAIEGLQKASVEICKAQDILVTAVKKTFVNQKKIAQGIEYLFGLGAMNMAANRTVVRELELKLKNASEEELSELAWQELNRVLDQLKAQQDIMDRIEKHKKAILDLQSNVNTCYSDIALFKDDCQAKFEEILLIRHKIEQELGTLVDDFTRLKDDTQYYLHQIKTDLDIMFQKKEMLLEASVSTQLDVFKTECNNVQKYCDDRIRETQKEHQTALLVQKETLQSAISPLCKKTIFNSNLYIFLLTIISFVALIFHFIGLK